MFPFQLNWSEMVPKDWAGPIVVRSVDYFSHMPELLSRHHNRVIHNSLILLFVLSALPAYKPDPMSCTKATMWAMPQATSALYLTQHQANNTKQSIHRVGLFIILRLILIYNAFRLSRSRSCLKR